MSFSIKSIRPFIGSKDYQISRNFYQKLGFQEVVLTHNLSYFKIDDSFGFYLQDAYVKDWIDNSMLFVEVPQLEEFWEHLVSLDLPATFQSVRIVPIQYKDWGKECFIHDPSGILWHFGTFY
jgi:catechol 2,3-dioxygenase-like lactoylglutathione lyase family enzyme